jgi:lactoylglutathione lyase
MIKRITFLTLLLIAGVNVFGQTGPRANHVALYVKDLSKSEVFYRDVMQLKVIPEPFHDGKHVWFRTGDHSQLHIIQGAAAVTDHDINSHFAYAVTNIPNFAKHLDQMKIKYGNWKGDSQSPQIRPDGIKQIYLQDPDNYWIEVNDDKF